MVARETQGLNPTCATHPRTHCARDDGSQDPSQVRSDGTMRSSCLRLYIFGVERSPFLPDFQRDGGDLRASVNRAISGRIPLFNKPV